VTAAGGPRWLASWARRKAAARKASVSPAALPTVPAASRVSGEQVAHPKPVRDPAMPPTAAPGAAPAVAAPTEELPPIESLDYDSDFSPYFRPGVPEALQQQALRKLWRTNPVLANLDGLNDYDEDYSSVGMIQEAVDTLFQIGRGMPDSVAASDAAPQAAAMAQPSGAASGTADAPASGEATSSGGDGAPAQGAPPGKTT